jgi:uncharacterized protein (DUF302 family)
MYNKAILVALFPALVLLVLSCAATGEALTPGQLDQDTRRYTVATEKPFDDVVEDIVFAIGQHNYRITGRNDIGKAIAKRSGQPYPAFAVLHFCNIQVAKRIYDINPDFALHMPCRIAVRAAGDRVIIESRLIPENDPDMHALAVKINRMMRDIADYAAQ